MSAQEDGPMQVYRGNCHCGAFVYEALLPEIDSLYDCNCSICVKKGYLSIFPIRSRFKVVKGDEDALTSYSFGPKKLIHKFCPKCGTGVMGVMENGPPGMDIALNAHTLQNFNTWDIFHDKHFCATLNGRYVEPAHKGDDPEPIEGGETYTGSCHCGKVTVAVNTKPLDETYEGAVECNCSICERNAYIWIYPKTPQVVLTGPTSKYSFATGLATKTFCSTCGVNMTNTFGDPNPEKLAALGDKEKEMLEGAKAMHPVNVRVLHGVDLEKLKTKRVDGFNTFGEPYENP